MKFDKNIKQQLSKVFSVCLNVKTDRQSQQNSKMKVQSINNLK